MPKNETNRALHQTDIGPGAVEQSRARLFTIHESYLVTAEHGSIVKTIIDEINKTRLRAEVKDLLMKNILEVLKAMMQTGGDFMKSYEVYPNGSKTVFLKKEWVQKLEAAVTNTADALKPVIRKKKFKKPSRLPGQLRGQVRTAVAGQFAKPSRLPDGSFRVSMRDFLRPGQTSPPPDEVNFIIPRPGALPRGTGAVGTIAGVTDDAVRAVSPSMIESTEIIPSRRSHKP